MAGFRERLYRCMTRWADALSELADALLCTDGPVKTLVGLSLAPEHRRGHGAMYDVLNAGRIDVESLCRHPAGLPLPRAACARLVLAVDVSPWLRPDGDCSPQRSFCHTYGRGKDEHRMIRGFGTLARPAPRQCVRRNPATLARTTAWLPQPAHRHPPRRRTHPGHRPGPPATVPPQKGTKPRRTGQSTS